MPPQQCFFILTCAHNFAYKNNAADDNFKMAEEISIILGKNKNYNFAESVNEEYALKLYLNPQFSIFPKEFSNGLSDGYDIALLGIYQEHY